MRLSRTGHLPNKKDAQSSCLKKSPSLGTIQEFCTTWTEATKTCTINATVARELVNIAGQLTPGQLPIAIPLTLVNLWRTNQGKWSLRAKSQALRRLLIALHLGAGAPNFAALVPNAPKGDMRTRTASTDELTNLYTAAAPHMRFCLICWTQLGMRKSEALRPTPKDFDPIKSTITTITKGKYARTYPATKELRALIESLYPIADDKLDTPLFLLLRQTPNYRGEQIRNIKECARKDWNKLLKATGTPTDLHIHDLRRTGGTAVHRQTGDVLAAQQFLGHRSLAATTHYLKPFEPDRMRQLTEQLQVPWTKKQPTGSRPN